jgi:hypothetical protein
MMKLVIGTMMRGMLFSMPAQAAAPAVCGRLASDYDFLDRQVAMSNSEDLTDDSAPRANLRATRNLDAHTKQLMILEIMRSQSCPLPTMVGGDTLYLTSALACSTARLKGTADAPECKLDSWVRDDKVKKTQ